MFYWRFHFDNETLVNRSFNQWKWTYFWILDLEGEVHSIWDMWVSGLQECKSNEFFKIRRAGNIFRAGPILFYFFVGRLPPPNSDNPKSSWGGVFNVLHGIKVYVPYGFLFVLPCSFPRSHDINKWWIHLQWMGARIKVCPLYHACPHIITATLKMNV